MKMNLMKIKLSLVFVMLGLTLYSNAQTALDFSGSNWVQTGVVSSLSDFTIEMNIRRDASSGSAFQRFMSTDANGLSLAVNESSGLVEVYSADFLPGWTSMSYSLTVGTWTHLAFVRSGTTLSLYVNGAFQSSVGIGSGNLSSSAHYICANQANFIENADATVDNYRVWDDARTATEIADFYQACLDGSEANLIVLFDMDEGSGTTLTDLATGDGSQDGTLVSGPVWTTGVSCTLFSPCPLTDIGLSTADFTSICSIDTTIELSSSDLSTYYFLRNDADNSVIDGPVEGTGAAVDFSTGTVSATTTYNVYGKSYGTALDFDGVDEYVDLGTDAAFDITADITLETWVYVDALPTDWVRLVGKGEFVANRTYGLWLHPSGTLLWQMYGPTNLDLATSDVLSVGQWYHLAAVREGTACRVYINGVEVASTTYTDTPNLSTQPATIGAAAVMHDYLDGQMDEVRIWNVARSEAEINSAMYDCLTGTESGLVACYHFEDGTGSSTATDAASSLDGTLMNMEPALDWVDGTYTCGLCDLEMTDMVTITIDPLADPSVTVDEDTLCPPSGGTTNMNVISSQSGVNYYLRNDADDSVIDGPVAGTGGDIVLDPGTISTTTTFNVNASAETVIGSTTVLEMDGVNEYVRTSANVVQDGTWTYETWVKPNDPTPSWSGVITANSGVGTGMWFQYCLSGTGQMRWESVSPALTLDNIGPVVNDNTWHHVAVTCDGTNITFYTDGVQTLQTTYAGGTMDRPLHIMAERGPTQWIPGQVDQTMVWDYARSAAEIVSDMNGGCTDGTETGMLVYYDYEDGTGLTVTDLAGGDQNGNMINMETTDWISAAGPSLTCVTCESELTDVVTVYVVDVTDPVITTCATDVTVPVDASCNYSLADFTGSIVATDNCDASPTITQSPTAGTTITGHGTVQTVTITVQDASGNSTNCTFDVTLNDGIAPTISCPSDMTVSVDASCEYSIPDLTGSATVSDNCDASPAVTQLPTAGTIVSGHGTIQTITLTATDAAGNSSNCSFDITLNDDTDPVISGCPSDITVAADAAGCTAVVSWVAPTESDNCTGVSMTSTHSPGDTFSEGVTTVTYTATDGAGNTAVCSFDVTVTNDLAVVVDSVHNANCADSTDGQAFITVSGGTAAYTFDWDADGTGDFDDLEDQDGLGVGTYNVIVEDANGCQATNSASISEPTPIVVTVDSEIDPSACATPDGAINVTVTGGTPGYTYDWDNDGTGDFDDTEDLSALVAGTYNLAVMDMNGCPGSVTGTLSDPSGATITLDSIDDNICYGDTLGGIWTTISGGVSPYIYDWDADGSGDADDTTFITNQSAGTYTLTITDDNGCITNASYDILEPAEVVTPVAITICSNDSIFVEGAYHNTSGVYSDTLATMIGCDSIIQTTLTVNSAYETVLSPISICQGDSALIFGTYYQMEGVYYDSMTTTLGCDSVEVQQLMFDVVDISISVILDGGGSQLKANASGAGVTYQWIDCSDNSAIAGETNQIFVPATDGVFAVVVNDGMCSDTSACTQVKGVGINEIMQFDIAVYPNPAHGKFTVELQSSTLSKIEVYDALGKLIYTVDTSENKILVDLSFAERGVYRLKISTSNGVIHKQVVMD